VDYSRYKLVSAMPGQLAYRGYYRMRQNQRISRIHMVVIDRRCMYCQSKKQWV